MGLDLSSPAKINLFLRVIGRRPDGFHELDSLMVAVDLKDRISMEFGGDGIRISCSHPDVPEDNRNLVWKAVALFQARYQEKAGALPFTGIRIELEKQIPVGGGLGGGSSNAATVLAALNQRFDQIFETSDLMKMGLELGADVPFFIHFYLNGTPAFARGVGERLTACEELPPFYALLCCPGVFSSTADVFKNFDFGLTLAPNYTMNTGSNLLPKEQGAENWNGLVNDLEQSAFKLSPKIGSTKEEMALLLQQKVYMSGSGSSLFALFSDKEGAEDGFETLSRAWSGQGRKVFLVRSMNRHRRI